MNALCGLALTLLVLVCASCAISMERCYELGVSLGAADLTAIARYLALLTDYECRVGNGH